MPITYTRDGNSEVQHLGRVLEVRHYEAQRNCSDTLDYSDYRTVQVTEALVYAGRIATPAREGGESVWVGSRLLRSGEEIPLDLRFGWVDCSNLFTWRGEGVSTPEVDTDALANPELAADFEAWQALMSERARVAAEERAAAEAAEAKRKAEAERNRPVRGKRMVVAKGRKVPIGTAGTVAALSDGHYGLRVLLKPDSAWQDRKVDGVWVDARNLVARDGLLCTKHTDCAKHHDLAAACAESTIIPLRVA